MSVIVDSYSESNQNANAIIASSSYIRTGVAQSFTGNGSTLTRMEFYLKKVGAPDGAISCRLYAHTGTFGTDGLPIGGVLVYADAPLYGTDLTTGYQLKAFNFSGEYPLVNGTHYFAAIEYTGGDSSNYIAAGYDSTGSTHIGNMAVKPDTIWYSLTDDLCFYVYGDFISPLPTFFR